MSVYLYGLMRCDDLPQRLENAPIEGLSGPLRALSLEGGLMLALSDSDGQPVPQRRRFLKGHARVLEQLMAHGPLLPFRFGHVARDTGRIAALVAEAQDEIAEHFAQIDGHAELGLRIAFDREAALATTVQALPDLTRQRDALIARGGGSRMAQIDLGRAVAEALDRRRTDAQRQILRSLSPLARAHVLHAPEDDAQVLRAAFLLPDGEIEAFVQAAEVAAEACGFADSAPQIRVVHPTPPFNFVTLALGADPESEVA